MTKPTIYLLRMALFLFAVAVTFVVLFPAIQRAFVANPGLNGLILGVGLLGIIYSFRQVWTLGREVLWMETVRTRRPGLSLQPNPRLLATVATALGDRERPVRLSAQTMRSLLDSISSRLDEQGAISRYLTGLLIFLGLLGTFWGLLDTVAAIAAVIRGLQIGSGEVADLFRDLKAGLEAPLSGMGTAFSSSLFGLAGSLVLGFLDLQAGQAHNRFFNELEEWMATQAKLSARTPMIEGDQPIPAYIQALLEQTAESLDELQRTVAKAEDGRGAATRSLLTLTEKLDVLADQMRAEQNLLVKLAEQHIEIRPLIAALANSHAGLDEATREHVRNLDRQVSRLADELVAGRGELMRDMRSEIKLLARTIAATREEHRSGD